MFKQCVCLFKNDRTNAVAYGNAHFGQGIGYIYFDDLECTGSETDLFSCRRVPVGFDNCDHSEDAGVHCGKSIRLLINLQNNSKKKIKKETTLLNII